MARQARSRNLARLRRLTIGTAALGVAATSGFGYLAAMNYTGTTTAATAAYTTTGTAATATPSSSTTSSATSAPTITPTTSTAHVSSGGS